MAIYQCLLSLPTDVSTKFLIFSDSKTSLKKLQQYQAGIVDVLTSHIIFYINHLLRSGIEIKFVWIPAHHEIIGHDIVDSLAKVSEEPYLPLLNPDDLKLYLQHILYIKWKTEWQQQISKLGTIKRDIQDWTRTIGKTCKNSRHIETSINRIYLGHSKVTHQHLFLRQPSPTCDNCPHSQLTIRHLIEECSIYNQQRRLLRDDNFPQNISINNVSNLYELVMSTNLSTIL